MFFREIAPNPENDKYKEHRRENDLKKVHRCYEPALGHCCRSARHQKHVEYISTDDIAYRKLTMTFCNCGNGSYKLRQEGAKVAPIMPSGIQGRTAVSWTAGIIAREATRIRPRARINREVPISPGVQSGSSKLSLPKSTSP
ncbi:hypothetical protein [Desulfosediminicola sp.]|uniref:hypothetical protein n=1 Tax=Desulfosediminicola sp. TaxID=2886825 RepID=UPI003AF220A0